MSQAICRNCKNTGTGWDGRPCACKLPSEWQVEIGRRARTEGELRDTIDRLSKRVEALTESRDGWKARALLAEDQAAQERMRHDLPSSA